MVLSSLSYELHNQTDIIGICQNWLYSICFENYFKMHIRVHFIYFLLFTYVQILALIVVSKVCSIFENIYNMAFNQNLMF